MITTYQLSAEVQNYLASDRAADKQKNWERMGLGRAALCKALRKATDANFYVYIMAKGAEQEVVRLTAEFLGYERVVLKGTPAKILKDYQALLATVAQGKRTQPLAIFYYRDETTLTQPMVRSRSNHATVLDKTIK